MLDEHLAEIRIGIYATPADAARLVEECGATLRRSAVPHEVSAVEQDQAQAGEEVPLAEFYDELPQQWRLENPGACPGARRAHEIRVLLVTSRPRLDALREELSRTICPDPAHAGPCPIPWASSSSASGRRYASLRAR
ncbi:hypothetical protein ABT324_16135 [Saccharopolyspora sp. NPDC000359]|uniref:hypothetical protein n=1 Tax=Saccharopolyspora sp. NPDC000359 TaxID=3154251 RepID=UPI00332C6F09